jgi:hypothetical protein
MSPFWKRNKNDALRAKKARIDAERALRAAKRETPKYRELAESLIDIQQKNHLGLNAARMLRGEK